MSYDIALNDPVTGDIIELSEPHFMQGGTYAVGGTTEFWLNITYISNKRCESNDRRNTHELFRKRP